MSSGIRANRYEFETEQLIILTNERIAFREVPIQTIYIDDNRESHFHPLYNSLRIYFVLLRYAMASAAAATTDLVAFWIIFGIDPANSVVEYVGEAGFAVGATGLLQGFVFRRKIRRQNFCRVYRPGAGVRSDVQRLADSDAAARNVPLLTKIVADTLVFLFNFLFIRRVHFSTLEQAATED